MQCSDQTAQMNYDEMHAEIFNMCIYSFNPIVLRKAKLYTILGFLSAIGLSVFAPKSVIAS